MTIIIRIFSQFVWQVVNPAIMDCVTELGLEKIVLSSVALFPSMFHFFFQYSLVYLISKSWNNCRIKFGDIALVIAKVWPIFALELRVMMS